MAVISNILDLEDNIEIAQSLFKQSKYQEAIDTCHKILATDSNSIEAVKLIAKSLLATKKINDARLYFNNALNINPEDYEFVLVLAWNFYDSIVKNNKTDFKNSKFIKLK